MAKSKVILIDADVISHFIVTGNIMRLHTILSPHSLFVVDNVYKEATNPCLGSSRKETIDKWIIDAHIYRIPFPEKSDNVRREFYRLKKDCPLLDEGERACVAMARFGKETIASSNFRDIKPYCETNGIEYIGCTDILYIANQRGIMSESECDQFIARSKLINNARLPSNSIKEYIPDRNLDEYIRQ